MTDDLVKRLRLFAPYDLDLTEAADRIEALEAALQHCVNAIRQYEMGDDRPRGSAGDIRPWLLGAMDNARKTLEGKKDV